MLGLRSLRNRLAVVFGLIVFGAVGTIYLTVTPRLEERLQEQKLDRLQADARTNVDGRTGFAEGYVPDTARSPEAPVLPETRVSAAAVRSSAEVLILDVLRGSPQAVAIKIDSAPDGGVSESDVSALANEAVAARRPVASTMTTGAGRQAVVAYPLIKDDKVEGVA